MPYKYILFVFVCFGVANGLK